MNQGEADTIGLTDTIRMLGTNSTAIMSIDLRAAAVPSTNLRCTVLSLTWRVICLPLTKHMIWCCDSATCPTSRFRPRALLLMSMPDSSLPEIPVAKESQMHVTRVSPLISSMAKANPSTATPEPKSIVARVERAVAKAAVGKKVQILRPSTQLGAATMDGSTCPH